MRVTAIESIKNGVCRKYGEGELLGNKTPDKFPYNIVGKNVLNPCILLDTGKYVWGFECWWGTTKKFESEYGSSIKETVMIEPANIKPL